MRKFFIFLIFLSCAKGVQDNKIKVTFWHAMGGPLGRTLEKLIDEFNEKNDSIKVISVNMGNYNALSQKIMASILSKKTPTIAQVYETWTTSLWNAKVIYPADDFIKKDTIFMRELDDFFKVFIDDNTYDSIIVTLPFNKSVSAYFYNKDIFEKKGIKRFPETYEEMMEVMRKLSSKDTLATAFSITVGLFEQLLYSFGGRLLDEELKPIFDSEEGVKAIRYLQDMVFKYKVAKITTGYEHQDLFLSGKVCFIMGSSVSYSYLMRAQPDFRIGLAPMPKGKERVVFIMGTNIAVFRNAKEKERDAAWVFIKWFLSPEIQARWAIATGYVPVRKSSFNTEIVRKKFEEEIELKSIWEQLDYAVFEPTIPQWYIGRKLLSQITLEPALKSDEDPEKLLKLGKEEVLRAMQQEY
uniref:ABC transporter substrate-binding protein n=1 Tax=candidate division WOR-3 bacterium TaxID=2052148 RepID=A0A7C4U714_UNCW3